MSSLDNIKPVILELCEVIEMIKDLDAKKKELEEQVRPVLLDKGPHQVGSYIIEVKSRAGSKTLDKEALKAAFGDISAYEKVGKPSTVLSTKKVNVVD